MWTVFDPPTSRHHIQVATGGDKITLLIDFSRELRLSSQESAADMFQTARRTAKVASSVWQPLEKSSMELKSRVVEIVLPPNRSRLTVVAVVGVPLNVGQRVYHAFSALAAKLLKRMAGTTGLEPAASAVTVRLH
jgi:hypothetical protein